MAFAVSYLEDFRAQERRSESMRDGSINRMALQSPSTAAVAEGSQFELTGDFVSGLQVIKHRQHDAMLRQASGVWVS
jgi:hypothetical protein